MTTVMTILDGFSYVGGLLASAFFLYAGYEVVRDKIREARGRRRSRYWR
jgi:hypothetical protein